MIIRLQSGDRHNFDGFSRISAAYKDPAGKTLYVAGKVNGSSAELSVLPGKQWAIATLDLTYFMESEPGGEAETADFGGISLEKFQKKG